MKKKKKKSNAIVVAMRVRPIFFVPIILLISASTTIVVLSAGDAPQTGIESSDDADFLSPSSHEPQQLVGEEEDEGSSPLATTSLKTRAAVVDSISIHQRESQKPQLTNDEEHSRSKRLVADRFGSLMLRLFES